METRAIRGRPGRLQSRTVRGEPIHVGGRTLTPLIKVVSYGQAKATVGTRQVGARGGGFVRITPVAVLESTPDGENRIPIQDATRSAMLGILGLAAIVTLLVAATRRLVRRPRKAVTEEVKLQEVNNVTG